jgi:hypothetical protein
MLEDIIVIGIVMGATELVKRAMKKAQVEDEAVTQVTPFVVITLAGAAQVANAAVFGADIPWQEALKQGLTLGAISGGIYSLGKAALGKS